MLFLAYGVLGVLGSKMILTKVKKPVYVLLVLVLLTTGFTGSGADIVSHHVRGPSVPVEFHPLRPSAIIHSAGSEQCRALCSVLVWESRKMEEAGARLDALEQTQECRLSTSVTPFTSGAPQGR